MGKRIIARARGKGGPRYRAPSHRYLGRVEYIQDRKSGKVLDIVHDPARGAPIAVAQFDSEIVLHIASEGLKVGDRIEYGGKADVGNVLELSEIPIGTKVFGIETFPGSGPKLCRATGTFATVFGRSAHRVSLTMPSGRVRSFNERCRATIGVPAGGGRVEKPWVKAGKKWRAKAARGKLFPRTKGVAMGPVDHPFGGRKKAPRPSRIVSRHAPPGAKVGSISARRVGRKKGKK